MNQPVELGNLLPRSSESNQFAKNWWNDEKARPLPGEEQNYTVLHRLRNRLLRRLQVLWLHQGIRRLPCRFTGHSHGRMGTQRVRPRARPTRPLRDPVHQVKLGRPGRQGTPGPADSRSP